MATKKIDKIIEDDIIDEEVNEELPVKDLLVEDLPINEDEEVSEEVVQAVANAIVEEAEETDKKVEEVVNEIVEESKNDLDKLVEGRGFKSYDAAVEYASSEAFGKLHPFDQEEFNNWLKNIK